MRAREFLYGIVDGKHSLEEMWELMEENPNLWG